MVLRLFIQCTHTYILKNMSLATYYICSCSCTTVVQQEQLLFLIFSFFTQYYISKHLFLSFHSCFKNVFSYCPIFCSKTLLICFSAISVCLHL